MPSKPDFSSHSKLSGKRNRRHAVVIPEKLKEAKPIVGPVVDPAIDWQPIGGGYEMKLEGVNSVIKLRKEETEEVVFIASREVLENLMRKLPKKVR